MNTILVPESLATEFHSRRVEPATPWRLGGMMRTVLAAPLALALLCAAPSLYAGPYVVGPIISGSPGDGPPAGPDPHPGKEYSHEPDKDAADALDPGQVIRWDGAGGIADGTDLQEDPDERQVDAIANSGDAFFLELIDNKTPIAFSLRDGAGADVGVPVHFETTAGVIGDWASAADVDQHGVKNLDGLEIWGSEVIGDTDRYSLLFDAAGGTSIYNADGSTFLAHSALVDALQGFFEVKFFEPDIIDIDALMVRDLGASGEFEAGDSILFSLWPFVDPAMSIVGDEVFLWEMGPVGAPGGSFGFLNHGGHEWKSGWLDKNVDAIEALAVAEPVPEPLSLALLGLGLAGIGFTRTRSGS